MPQYSRAFTGGFSKLLVAFCFDLPRRRIRNSRGVRLLQENPF
jgi:hypothetical protein